MIKKLLACLFVAGTATMGVYAQTEIAGDYVGTLTVTVEDNDPTEMPDQSIGVVKEEGGETYSLSIKDFTFSMPPVPDVVIGDLNLGGLTTSEEAGAIILKAKGEIAGPEVEVTPGLPKLPTTLTLEDANIMDNNLALELTVKAGKGETAINVLVEFTGNKQASGIADTNADKLNIFVSQEANLINVVGEADNYVIFNTAGAMVQSGAVNEGTISIADLKGGIYVVKVDNHIAKFIKK